ncbi:MAG: hypothetical protein RLZZ555_82 [Pseudomonadota bacterium]|jgi:hypothetical protein
MATAKKAAPAKKAAAKKTPGPADQVDPAVTPETAAPAKKVTAARKAAAKKTAKPQPPAEPAALTRISPTAAWPFPTGPRP